METKRAAKKAAKESSQSGHRAPRTLGLKSRRIGLGRGRRCAWRASWARTFHLLSGSPLFFSSLSALGRGNSAAHDLSKTKANSGNAYKQLQPFMRLMFGSSTSWAGGKRASRKCNVLDTSVRSREENLTTARRVRRRLGHVACSGSIARVAGPRHFGSDSVIAVDRASEQALLWSRGIRGWRKGPTALPRVTFADVGQERTVGR